MTGTFPQSDLQHAYLLGELGDFQLGGPALFYEEYAVPPDAALRPARLADAVETLMRRHEMLRTTFAEDGFARVHEQLPVPVTVEDLRGRPDQSRVVAASREELHDAGPPLRDHAPFAIRVFRLDDGHRVQVCGRLLAIDGYSGEIFAQELRALLAGEPLDPIGYTYREYRTELARRETEPAYARARQYWLDRLDTLPPAPELPQRRGSPSPRSARLTRRSRRLTAEQWAGLAARARRHRLTPTQAVAAAFGEVLRHWSKSAEFTINVMYGERARLHPDVDRLIGNFSSTLLLAYSPGEQDRTFVDRARTLRRQLMLDTQHGAYGGVAVIRELNRRAGNVRAALMPVVFTSMLGVGEPDTGVFLEHLGWTRLEGRVRTPQVALDHQVFLAGGELVAQWDTADDLFPEGLIDDAFDAYHRLLVRLSTEDGAWLAERFDLTPARQLAVRTRINDTTVTRPPSTLHGPFLDRVRQDPDRIAVVTPTARVTYGELYARAAAVAGELRRRGVEPGDRVAVTLPRGVEQIAALLGTLLAGAAYVPVSPQWPARRAAAVLDIAKPAAVLDFPVLPGDRSVPPPEAWAADPDALAYVIFTSGTTGTPKGVMIRHGAAANTVLDVNQRFGVTAADAVLAVSDFTFDLSVYDVFGLLAAGGRVVVPDPELAREVVHLHELARRERVTVWNSVPAYLAMFVDFVRAGGGRRPLPDLRLALVSGDWVPVTMARDLATVAPAARCVSLGGATEASIWSNHFPVPVDPPADWASIPYGHPLANQGFHVYDADLVDRPDWVPGELYITGQGLADGYLGEAELTERAFQTHPRTGERVYRTGDWGRYWPDGTLEFLGREDPQVKVNGFRVELGEIEAALVAQPGVTDAAVVADRSTGGVRLAAFVSHSGAGSAHAASLASELTGRLRETLPAYMVPAVVDVRRALPLTPNGKVDRRALAAAAGAVGRTGYADPPATPEERRLVELWTELLGGVPVGATDDFFAAGGTSLQAARLMNRIEQAFGVRLPLATLYADGTPRALARRLAGRADAEPERPNLAVLADTAHPPLVLVHPVGGDLLCYRGLTRALAGRYRVLGLHGDAGGGTLGELARRYVDQVRAAVGGGPYRLAGWSLGGTVAYEMARLLHADGERCGVVLVDPWVYPGGADAEPTTGDLVNAFLVNLVDGAPVPPSAPNRSAAELLEEHRPLLAGSRPDLAGVETEELVELFRRFEANTRALLRHRIEPVDGVPVTVIEAVDGLAGPAGSYLVPLRRVWGTRPGVRYHRVPGNHFTLLSGPALATTAELLTARLP